ncbi:MAG: hypothetical protein H7316_16265 [Tardiphaga sp.]|uniref:hypothetical protein n=1 Tax=Tardiphaga sp. TaxID=1926292 RepID=UPI001989EE42|nr:hypothetical protein [Tardiphaga sp.]MBC7585299.1 hypothetical protein [Tardiphaga sp.]
MNHRLLIAVAAVIMAASAPMQAQTPASGSGTTLPSSAPAAAAAETIPSAGPAAPVERATPVNRDEATDTSAPPEAGAGIKPVASDDKVQRDNGDVRASDVLPGGK